MIKTKYMFFDAKAKDPTSEAKDLAFEAKAKDLAPKAKDMTSCPRGQGHGLEDSISANNCCKRHKRIKSFATSSTVPTLGKRCTVNHIIFMCMKFHE